MRERKSFLSILNMMGNTSTTISCQNKTKASIARDLWYRTEIWYVCLNMNGLQGTINFFSVAAHSGGQGGYFSLHLVYSELSFSLLHILHFTLFLYPHFPCLPTLPHFDLTHVCFAYCPLIPLTSQYFSIPIFFFQIFGVLTKLDLLILSQSP